MMTTSGTKAAGSRNGSNAKRIAAVVDRTGPSRQRLRVRIEGAVQGVGFRPFVYRLARQLRLDGRVGNDTGGVAIDLEGPRPALERFLARVRVERPPAAHIEKILSSWLLAVGQTGMHIDPSEALGRKTVQILPDVATCSACLDEVLDPSDRRHRYAFTNCTHCGPRLAIVRTLPYDRPRTTMERFTMCPACRSEYDDPRERRFHAQPNACPDCGPRLELWSGDGKTQATGDAALRAAALALRQGRIVAVKGLGGFHLMVDAGHGAAIERLRARKPRREKPLALMVRDMEQARLVCLIDEAARRVLSSPEAPIVLLPRRSGGPVHEAVAPGNPYLGIMLPYTPLHHLLLRAVDFPLVATSGNLTEEPICTNEREALERLGGIAEVFLVHDRPIARHVDDSVVWICAGAPRILRRARGHAPRPILLDRAAPVILAVGGHLKNTVALSVGHRVFVSQHIGNMETAQARTAFERVVADFLELYEAEPAAVAHDLHPDYVSTRWAREAVAGSGGRLEGKPLVPVQHHHAHLAACLAENAFRGAVLGVIWDGAGYGGDGTLWGGEFLVGDPSDFDRVVHLRPFLLPGGEAAIREPRRSAVALLWELYGARALERDDLEVVRSFRDAERKLLAGMLRRRLNTPVTTSAGRLFDGVAALLGLHQTTSFEGQAAMALEHVADRFEMGAYAFDLRSQPGGAVLDWSPLVEELLRDRRRGVSAALIAARFHNALVEAILRVAHRVGRRSVALSGGCFQNRWLTERTTERLRHDGFDPLLHCEVPPNDGAISLGQVTVAAARLTRRE